MNICDYCIHKQTCTNKPLATTKCKDFEDNQKMTGAEQMKKTTVQYFCDKCGCELKAHPDRCHDAGISKDYSGSIKHRYRVTVEYEEYMGVEFQQSMLCEKCKIEALEEVLKKLKERSKKK